MSQNGFPVDRRQTMPLLVGWAAGPFRCVEDETPEADRFASERGRCALASARALAGFAAVDVLVTIRASHQGR